MVKKSLALALAIASTISMASADAKTARFLEGNVAKENIDRVNSSIRWNTSLYQALDQARREDKMVLWVQMIGQMSGST
ncbi:MAG: hypothetical protein K2X93_17355 [Candidatus Obscuribacterales bacterium]|nr:hypothetical protein [Candidatus Obscuribacterales bacterium]